MEPLAARIDAELRERLEEAIEFLCLDALVQRRRALGLPAPAADSARDRAEFAAQVRAFLERLGTLAADLGPEQRQKVEAAERGTADETARLLAVQTVLARELPDYWQRFESARVAYTTARLGGLGGPSRPPMDSGGERRGLLGRLFGRG